MKREMKSVTFSATGEEGGPWKGEVLSMPAKEGSAVSPFRGGALSEVQMRGEGITTVREGGERKDGWRKKRERTWEREYS